MDIVHAYGHPIGKNRLRMSCAENDLQSNCHPPNINMVDRIKSVYNSHMISRQILVARITKYLGPVTVITLSKEAM